MLKKTYTIYKNLKIKIEKVNTPHGVRHEPKITFNNLIILHGFNYVINSDFDMKNLVSKLKSQLSHSDKLILGNNPMCDIDKDLITFTSFSSVDLTKSKKKLIKFTNSIDSVSFI